MSIILAIETSCDETSIAVVENGVKVHSLVTNTQIEHFAKLGGVVPEMSARMHLMNLPFVYKQALDEANMTITDIDQIAVTAGPGLIGSLLSGISFAKSLSILHNIPLVAVNHMQAHIYALELEYEITYPMLSLIVSGGHTELVYLKEEFSFELVGETLDDAAGECYDKIAKILELPYPGGPQIDRLAKLGQNTYELPKPKNDQTLDFSFSGLKSACFNQLNSLKMKGEEIRVNDFACSFQETVINSLISKLQMAEAKYQPKTIAIVGGVSANSRLKERAQVVFPNVLIPSFKYSTDNGAMIGAVAHHQIKRGKFASVSLNANPGATVEDQL